MSRLLKAQHVFLLALACLCNFAWSGEQVVVARDGSTTTHQKTGATDQELVFKFGLPPLPPQKMWREQGLIRGLWVTNGIRYTQTVLVTALEVNEPAPRTNIPVLLVNIHGENTNAEYAEATAELSSERAGKRQELDLNDGMVWSVEGGKRHWLGALEIPDSGVKTANGQVLRFHGNIPPALQGSMTLKVPLRQFNSAEAHESLRDIEFDAELKKTLKGGTDTPSAIGIEVILSQETGSDTATK